MINNDIPDEAKKFIYKYIESLEQLEVLLFLFNNRSDTYNARMIAQELRTNHESVALRLNDLSLNGFLILENAENKMYQYNQGNKDDSVIRQVDQVYLNFRHTIITLIFSKPLDSVRSFADAFKLKKDENDG